MNLKENHKHLYWIIFFVGLCLWAEIFINVDYASSAQAESINPCEFIPEDVSAPLTTLYFGDHALERPKQSLKTSTWDWTQPNWRQTRMNVAITPSDPELNGIICFTESQTDDIKPNGPTNERCVPKDGDKWHYVKIESNSLSQISDQQATLTVYYGRIGNNSDKSRLGFDLVTNETCLYQPLKNRDMVFNELCGYLILSYTEDYDKTIMYKNLSSELFAERKNKFLNQAAVILGAYHKTGENKQPLPNQLATTSGYFEVDNEFKKFQVKYEMQLPNVSFTKYPITLKADYQRGQLTTPSTATSDNCFGRPEEELVDIKQVYIKNSLSRIYGNVVIEISLNIDRYFFSSLQVQDIINVFHMVTESIRPVDGGQTAPAGPAAAREHERN